MTELLIGFILICIVLGAVLVFSLCSLIGSTIYISYLERRNTNEKETSQGTKPITGRIMGSNGQILRIDETNKPIIFDDIR